MHRTKILMSLTFAILASTAHAQVTELDQYLIKKNILNTQYKITNAQALNEILDAITQEDSRTMPYQIDQNTVIEKLELKSNHMELQGLIITPDFQQFVKDVGAKEVKSLIHKNLLQSCSRLFEYQFQRNNPYYIDIHLSADNENYQFKIKNTDCSFNP